MNTGYMNYSPILLELYPLSTHSLLLKEIFIVVISTTVTAAHGEESLCCVLCASE